MIAAPVRSARRVRGADGGGRISGRELREAYLDEPMLAYFARKFPDIARPDLDARIEETLKFLFIVDQCVGDIPVTREIDDVWHAWILQSQQYMQLCASLPFGDYIHHCSNDYLAWFEPAPRGDDDVENDVRMLASYVENFGPFEAERVKYWRLGDRLMTRFGWSVDELNAWLAGS